MAEGEFLEPIKEKKVHTVGRDRFEILKERFERLSAADQNLFQGGPFFLALNASLCGLIANSMFRRVLNITQIRTISALSVVFTPFAFTVVAYNVLIVTPLMEGDLNCATCTWVRGGLIGGVVGCFYPTVLALSLNAATAARSCTAPLPDKRNFLRYWITISKPIYKKMKFAVLLQVAFGTFLSSKHHEIYIKMLQLPEPGEDPEELKN
ncbi:transmembrane protein 126A-like [Rhineura floridana]|uniref:transmembrane protein 126A-like n=1 Tax=Rhineura floridana TaxID=261503 RepID=UPI002AC851DA|nr:transmembrane protein 126A-like [Rhineura floridana]XP_061484928.1 transmembrane protein 126A-like [Rhineura floridana]XP_061484929.1 transmembrane protein 126A-like [Rhineura floridana]